MTGEFRPLASGLASAVELLREVLDFINDHPSFGLRRDPRRTSYALAARIDRYLDALQTHHDAALATLPKLTVQILRAHRDGGLAYEDVATRFGLPVTHVTIHIAAATEILSAAFADLPVSPVG